MCGQENHIGEIGSDGEGSVYNLHAATRAGAMEKVSFEPHLKMRVRHKNLGKVIQVEGDRARA